MLPPAKKNFPPSRPASARGAKRHPWRRSRSGRTQDTIDAPRQARASGGLGESVKERRRRLETSANASDGQRLRSTLSSQPPPPPKKKRKKRKQGVGKSCLVLRYVRGCFDPGSKVTVGAAYLGHRATLADGRQCKLEVWDTAGQVRGSLVSLALLSSLPPLCLVTAPASAPSSACCSVPYSLCIFLSRSPPVSFFTQERYSSLAPLYYRGAAAAAVVFDVGDRESFAKARHWVGELQRNAGPGIGERERGGGRFRPCASSFLVPRAERSEA
jgi:hypothetical protein